MLKRLRDALALEPCDHVPDEYHEPRAERCEECGSRFSLRVCATCGHVGCCDSQFGHARVHFHETGHSVMRAKSAFGAGFIWCYADNRYVGERRTAAA